MPIASTTPTTIAATYDKVGFTITTRGNGCAPFGGGAVPPVQAEFGLYKYRIRDDGLPEASPLASDSKRFIADDVGALAAQFPSVAAALQALSAAVAEVAAAKGLL